MIIGSFVLMIVGIFLLIVGIVYLIGSYGSNIPWPGIIITWFGGVSLAISFYLLLIGIIPTLLL